MARKPKAAVTEKTSASSVSLSPITLARMERIQAQVLDTSGFEPSLRDVVQIAIRDWCIDNGLEDPPQKRQPRAATEAPASGVDFPHLETGS